MNSASQSRTAAGSSARSSHTSKVTDVLDPMPWSVPPRSGPQRPPSRTAPAGIEKATALWAWVPMPRSKVSSPISSGPPWGSRFELTLPHSARASTQPLESDTSRPSAITTRGSIHAAQSQEFPSPPLVTTSHAMETRSSSTSKSATPSPMTSLVQARSASARVPVEMFSP